MSGLRGDALWSLIAVLACSVALGTFSCRRSPSWKSVKEMVRRDFPEVRHLSAEELRHLMEPGAKPPVLLDVREEAEYAVSHLEGAVRVPPGAEVSEVPELSGLDPDTPIVAYCSVGYRSSELVHKLAESGFDNARSLEGSIFEWANEGGRVVRDGEPVRQVHPFDEEWGALLDPELRAYEPDPR